VGTAQNTILIVKDELQLAVSMSECYWLATQNMYTNALVNKKNAMYWM
jgi:hypothetical protein